jgi:2-keto-3-deoxy-L-rhamnonate aldolase RhmA
MYTELMTPSACRLAKRAGFDYIVIDTEHNFAGIESVAWMCRTGRDIGLPVIVRAPAFSGHWLARYLDIGASGLLVPHVEDGTEAEAIVRSVKFPPLGTRGLGGGAHKDYAPSRPADLVCWENENLLVVVQIETTRGLENRREILSVAGIDAVFIGPNDLALSMGFPGELEHPQVHAAMLEIFEAARTSSVVPGLHVFDRSAAKRWLAAGARFLCFSTEFGLMEHAARDALAEIRGHTEA